MICVWSALNGQLFNSLNTKFCLADLLVASNGSRIVGRFLDSPDLPIFSLNSKPVFNMDNKVLSQSNLKTCKNLFYILFYKSNRFRCF